MKRIFLVTGGASGIGAAICRAVAAPETGVLIAGDMCSDIEIPLLDRTSADPFRGYRVGLDLLASAPRVKVLLGAKKS